MVTTGYIAKNTEVVLFAHTLKLAVVWLWLFGLKAGLVSFLVVNCLLPSHYTFLIIAFAP